MLTIRPATKEDVPMLYELILGIARYHNQEYAVKTSVEELRRAGFGEVSKFGALIAEYEGMPAAYLSYTWNYSIWNAGSYMNLDDLFVKEEFRGKKIGEALMQEAKALCQSRDTYLIRWEVQKDNAGAIKFYERLGAKMKAKGIFRWELKEKPIA
ncbi:MAG: GNAT family N-acetyltransferase [Bacteroidota bacterium]